MDGNNDFRLVWSITILKRNGAVWTEFFEDRIELLDKIETIIGEYPHFVVSEKRLKLQE